jgi:hypothetical protein
MDPKLKRLLDGSGWRYSVDEDNDAKLVMAFEDGRSHMVLVEGAADHMGAYSDFTISAAVANDPSPEAVVRTMKATGNTIAGGFVFIGSMLVYKVDVSTDSSVEAFKAAVGACVVTADEAEKICTKGADAF